MKRRPDPNDSSCCDHEEGFSVAHWPEFPPEGDTMHVGGTGANAWALKANAKDREEQQK
jgi:hypothetical protein